MMRYIRSAANRKGEGCIYYRIESVGKSQYWIAAGQFYFKRGSVRPLLFSRHTENCHQDVSRSRRKRRARQGNKPKCAECYISVRPASHALCVDDLRNMLFFSYSLQPNIQRHDQYDDYYNTYMAAATASYIYPLLGGRMEVCLTAENPYQSEPSCIVKKKKRKKNPYHLLLLRVGGRITCSGRKSIRQIPFSFLAPHFYFYNIYRSMYLYI